jgi:hypothetical protein
LWEGPLIFSMLIGKDQIVVGRATCTSEKDLIFLTHRERPDSDRSKSGTCHHLCQSLMMLTSSHTAQFVKTSSYVLFPHFGFQKRKFTKHISFWSFPHVRPSHIIPTYDIYAFSATERGNYTTTPKTSPHLAISTISTIPTSILLHHHSTFNYPLYISISLVYICIVDHNRSLFLLICVTLPPTGPFWCRIGYKT